MNVWVIIIGCEMSHTRNKLIAVERIRRKPTLDLPVFDFFLSLF